MSRGWENVVMFMKQLVLERHWTQAADIIKTSNMGEFHVATFEQETRNEHKPVGGWTGGCRTKMLGRSHDARGANGLERDGGSRLIILKISRNMCIPWRRIPKER